MDSGWKSTFFAFKNKDKDFLKLFFLDKGCPISRYCSPLILAFHLPNLCPNTSTCGCDLHALNIWVQKLHPLFWWCECFIHLIDIVFNGRLALANRPFEKTELAWRVVEASCIEALPFKTFQVMYLWSFFISDVDRVANIRPFFNTCSPLS